MRSNSMVFRTYFPSHWCAIRGGTKRGAVSECSSHILLIEDEVVVRQQLASALREEGFRVSEAGDAVQAYDAIVSSDDLSLIITDVRLPGKVDGAGLAKVIEAHSPNLPVIIFSGGARPPADEMPQRAIFVEKPVRLDRLLREVQRLLDGADGSR
jgi:DNA-binding NtrC family response regulator